MLKTAHISLGLVFGLSALVVETASGQAITHQVALPSGSSYCDDGMINSLFSQINLFRTQSGAPALGMDNLGMKDAELRAVQFMQYMATAIPGSVGFNPHQGYDTTAASIGYDLISENLAYLTSDPIYVVLGLWQDSLHLAALLSTQANVAGVSCIYDSTGTPYWTYEPGFSTNPSPPPTSSGASTPDSEAWAFLTLINNYRVQNGVGTLQVSAALQNSSQWMSSDMASKNYVSHTDSLGRDPGTRMAAFGYTFSPWGENIAAGFSDAQDTFSQWVNACDPDSSGACTFAHRTNMLYSGFQVIGIGRASNSNSSYGWYWTTDFGGVVDSVIPPPNGLQAPSITGFSVSPSTISPGGFATLSWSTSGAATVTIDNGIGAVAGAGSGSVSPSQTTTYKLTAANSAGTVTATATLTVGATTAVPVITSATTASGKVGTAFSYQTTATNSPTSFGATGLPGGLSVNAAGLISGTPTVAGTFVITLSAANSGGTGHAALSLTVLPATVVAPVITSALTTSAKVGNAFLYQTTATNSPTSFAAAGLPAGLSVNSAGLILGTPTTAGTFMVTLSASNSGGTGQATLTLTVAPPTVVTPVITSALTASAKVGTAYLYQITATNSPTSFSASGLPAGLSVNTAGLILGTPTTAGTSMVTLSATNSSGTGSATLTLTVAPPTVLAPVITSATTASGKAGTAFSYQITATNSPTSFGATGLPTGLSVNAAGLITGTPAAAGTAMVMLSAANSGGTGNATLTLSIAAAAAPAPVITSATSASGKAGTVFSYQITATNSPLFFGATGLPAGLSVTGGGLISGTPATAGTTMAMVTATNNTGTGSATLTLSIAAATVAAPVITSATTASGRVGTAFAYQITATNSPTFFGAASLPAGLSISGAGLISGTPTAAGTTLVTLSATNNSGTGNATLTVSIAAATTTSGISPSPGSTLPSPSAAFSWPAVSGVDQYWLDVGSQLAVGDYFGAATAGTSFNVTTVPCDGRTVFVQLWTHSGGAWQTPARYTYTAASGCAALTSPADNSTLASASVVFSWNAASGADQYWLDVGNSIGHGDVFGAATTATSATVSKIPCDGRTIYVQLWTHIAGAWKNPGRYQFTANSTGCSSGGGGGTGGGTSGITSPAPGSVLASPSQAFNWTAVSGADQYWLDVGSQMGLGDYFGGTTTALSVTVNSIPCDGRTVYVQSFAHVGGVWQTPQQSTYQAASGCAALTAPVNGSTFTAASVNFSWGAAAGADQYWLDVGNSAGHGDIMGAATTATSATVSNIPCDGRTIYVQLWTHIGGVWKNPGRYEYKAWGVCGRLATPAPGATLTGSTVSFTWTPGTAVQAYWLDVGKAAASGGIFGANVGTALSHTVSGIPTAGQTVYVQLWSMIGGVWYPNRYTYTAF
jgi:uncharacterized protein YkwD